ncbi:MAG TPA: Xaa-Pro peptidase family protein [Bacteroidia bacterium]|jgi:Xaa-Pro dipeptidase|nr:Xaa-Pro peptidase family protein [Bacteroidia bacterium]
MNRRNFIKTTGIASALALTSTQLFAETISKPFPAKGLIDPAIIKKLTDRIKPITNEERAQRLEQARKLMVENKIDAIFMEGGTSLEYFTGSHWGRSERLFGMLLPKKGTPIFISPKFEESRAKEQTGNNKLYCWEEHESPFELFKKIVEENDLIGGTIAIEETTRYFVTEGFQKAIPTSKIVSGNVITAGCRGIKTEHEIELMQIANDMTMEVYKAAVTQLKENMSENEFAKIITQLFAEFGVGGGALILFGEASAHPHGLVKEVRLKQNDIVLIDGGCSVEGYESDITRTTVFGKPTQKMNDVFNIVLKAQQDALKFSKPGVSFESVDATARKVISDAGYGPGYKYFTHRLGHGIGMDGHEWYYVVGGNKRLIEKGNMMSNEPGIYILGEFGIRIEDEMLITENGAKLLLPKQQSLEVMF